jgi:hypothetical protein
MTTHVVIDNVTPRTNEKVAEATTVPLLRQKQQQQERHRLAQLPTPILALLLSFLPARSLGAMAQTNRQMRALVEVPSLWERILMRARLVFAATLPEENMHHALPPRAIAQVPRACLAWHYQQLLTRAAYARASGLARYVAYRNELIESRLLRTELVVPLVLWALLVTSLVLVVWATGARADAIPPLVYFVPLLVALAIVTLWLVWVWNWPNRRARGLASLWCREFDYGNGEYHEDYMIVSLASEAPHKSLCALLSLGGAWALLAILRFSHVLEWHWAYVMSPLWLAAALWFVAPLVRKCQGHKTWLLETLILSIFFVLPLVASSVLAVVRASQQPHPQLLVTYVMIPLFFIHAMVLVMIGIVAYDKRRECASVVLVFLAWLVFAAPWLVCQILLCVACDVASSRLTPLEIASPLLVFFLALCAANVAQAASNLHRLPFPPDDFEKELAPPPASVCAQLDASLSRARQDAYIV